MAFAYMFSNKANEWEVGVRIKWGSKNCSGHFKQWKLSNFFTNLDGFLEWKRRRPQDKSMVINVSRIWSLQKSWAEELNSGISQIVKSLSKQMTLMKVKIQPLLIGFLLVLAKRKICYQVCCPYFLIISWRNQKRYIWMKLNELFSRRTWNEKEILLYWHQTFRPSSCKAKYQEWPLLQLLNWPSCVSYSLIYFICRNILHHSRKTTKDRETFNELSFPHTSKQIEVKQHFLGKAVRKEEINIH